MNNRARFLIFCTIYLLIIIILFITFIAYALRNDIIVTYTTIFYLLLSFCTIIIIVVIRNIYLMIKIHSENINHLIELRQFDINTTSVSVNIVSIINDNKKIVVIHHPDESYSLGLKI